jgi:rhodanese-related sulfurtransferase
MRHLLLTFFFFFSFYSYGQASIAEMLRTFNSETVPYMSVQELAMPKTNAIILDARETAEYNVSHIKNAKHVGYNHFNIESLTETISEKTKTIVIYCAVGIRSETIGEQLKKKGYTNVYNLFGGIFEWKNNDLPVFNLEEKETDKVHAYSKAWSKWLLKGTKIYD